jgi:hypothetical protein
MDNTGVFTFNPTIGDIGKHNIKGYLSDGILQTIFSFDVKVMNS